MTQIKIEQPGCDGWAIFEKEYIEGTSPSNVHLVEAKISNDEEGNPIKVAPNKKRVTVCGKHKLKAKDFPNGKFLFWDASSDSSAIRHKLAVLQDTKEVCGRCVAHFYADQDWVMEG